MATQDTGKFLEALNTYVGTHVRSKLNTFYTIVTMTNTSLAQGFKEGYNDVLKGSPDLPEISDNQFNTLGTKALNKVAAYVKDPKSWPVLMPGSVQGSKLVYGVRRDVRKAYAIAKGEGVAGINKYLKSVGSRGLKGVKDYGGGDSVTARQTEVGTLKSGTHRAHQATSTVGAAQLSAAMEFLTRTKDFAGFSGVETSKDLMDIYSDIALKYTTTGTKTGGAKVSLNEKQFIEIFLGPRSENLAGSQSTDWRNLKPLLEDAVTAYLEKTPIEDRSGSKSIRENAEDQAEHILVASIVGNDARGSLMGIAKARVKGGKTKKSSRKKDSVPKVIAKPVKSRPGSSKKAKSFRADRGKTPAQAPLFLIGILNQTLPGKVQQNMVSPRLVNRTGRLARSARVTDISTTAQGFPSIGYTYKRDAYETFEMGNRQGSANRDPRRLIDMSIRQLAAQFAIGRFYTRRG